MKRIFYFTISLFCFAGQAYSQTPQQLYDGLPKVDGWEIAPETEVFNRDNLYERINGAAPLYLENNFQEMTSMVYTKGDEYITIQAYRHASPEDAFGMYASERSSEMTHYPGIGGDAQGDEYGLYFFSGAVYVKITSSDEGEVFSVAMKEIAKDLAVKIDANPAYPAIIRAFPKEGQILYSEAYITQNYIGHEFLKPAFTVDYSLNGKKFQAFVIDNKTPDGAKQMLTEYFKFTKQDLNFSEGNLLVKDRYNGNIPVVWKGRFIIGAFDETGADFPDGIYDFLRSIGTP
ncbi:MAG: hypothetical protein LBT25_12450 [Candidatus Symbiothrix sp.]|jgi:hypothetical protein|nr:hypothetical protein [Candidatus Symbiothrix sp.]